MDPTDAEDIKKRWQEHTEELYKKDLNDPDDHNSVITHIGPVILEREVKWALESITMHHAFIIVTEDAVSVLKAHMTQRG